MINNDYCVCDTILLLDSPSLYLRENASGKGWKGVLPSLLSIGALNEKESLNGGQGITETQETYSKGMLDQIITFPFISITFGTGSNFIA